MVPSVVSLRFEKSKSPEPGNLYQLGGRQLPGNEQVIPPNASERATNHRSPFLLRLFSHKLGTQPRLLVRYRRRR